MKRLLLTTVAASALYGFSVGLVHSLTYALLNVIKLPLLLACTALTCTIAYYLAGKFVTRSLSLRHTLRLAWGMVRDLSVLLASFASVSVFLACTIDQPDARGLHEYPFFMGFNVVLIAVCGVVSLSRQARMLLHQHRLSRLKTGVVLAAWLGVSLLVGSQASWYLRPFFGVSTIPPVAGQFCLGTEPDFRGARSFFEAVGHLVDPPGT